MKAYPQIDYTYRPANYWSDSDPLTAILRNVKGTNRRAMITDYWNAGKLDQLNDNLLKAELSSDERRRLAQIHPSFMGGEYLPPYLFGEVEIARLQLQSTTADVVSIRARLQPQGRIAYRVVDEYPEDWTLSCRPKTSQRPLSLRQLIRLLDTGEQSGADLAGGFALGYNEMNASDDDEGSRERLRHFTHVSSPFYPQLVTHYEHVFDDWVQEERAEEVADGEGDSAIS